MKKRALSPCMLDSVNTVKLSSVWLGKGNSKTLLEIVPRQRPSKQISPRTSWFG